MRIDLTMRMSPDGYLDDIVSIDVSGVDNPAHANAVKSSLRRNLDRANCDFSDVLSERQIRDLERCPGPLRRFRTLIPKSWT